MGLADLVLPLREGSEEGPPCATEEGRGGEVEFAFEFRRVARRATSKGSFRSCDFRTSYWRSDRGRMKALPVCPKKVVVAK